MIIRKSQAILEPFANGKIYDYLLPDEKIGISFQEYESGRAPSKGWAVNKKCYEIYFIVSGSAEIYLDNEHSQVESGDLVIIKPKQKIYFISHKLKMITVTQPNFFYEQYEEIRE